MSGLVNSVSSRSKVIANATLRNGPIRTEGYIQHGLTATDGHQYSSIYLAGYSAPNVAFEYDFKKATYGTIFEVRCGISHWNGNYHSFKNNIIWGYNNQISGHEMDNANGGNGTWNISFPSNNILRVKMDGSSVSYTYTSGWYIKISGNLNTQNPET